jgi:hypothetical protein
LADHILHHDTVIPFAAKRCAELKRSVAMLRAPACQYWDFLALIITVSPLCFEMHAQATRSAGSKFVQKDHRQVVQFEAVDRAIGNAVQLDSQRPENWLGNPASALAGTCTLVPRLAHRRTKAANAF